MYILRMYGVHGIYVMYMTFVGCKSDLCMMHVEHLGRTYDVQDIYI